jgi:hypothetical protein
LTSASLIGRSGSSAACPSVMATRPYEVLTSQWLDQIERKMQAVFAHTRLPSAGVNRFAELGVDYRSLGAMVIRTVTWRNP